jgi:hypothetical protein
MKFCVSSHIQNLDYHILIFFLNTLKIVLLHCIFNCNVYIIYHNKNKNAIDTKLLFRIPNVWNFAG